MCFFRSARALSRHGPWTATSTFAPIEWSVIVPGAGVGRTKKPKVVRHPPTMWRGGTTISPGFGIRHRAVATCCSGIMSCRCLRDHLGGLGSPVGRSARYVDQIPTQYDHGEGSEGLESHIRRSARFLFPRRHVGKTASRSTSRVVRVCQTWPRASRSRPGSVWSGWAKRDRQRTMHMDTSPAACQSQSMHPPLRRRPVRRRCFSFTAVSPSDRGMMTFYGPSFETKVAAGLGRTRRSRARRSHYRTVTLDGKGLST